VCVEWGCNERGSEGLEVMLLSSGVRERERKREIEKERERNEEREREFESLASGVCVRAR